MSAVPVGLVSVKSPEVPTYNTSPSEKADILTPAKAPEMVTAPVALLAMLSLVMPTAGMVDAAELSANAIVVSLPEAPEI